ncbi:hypothetical protein, partial [uncultured Cetobacterium sp.]|uniref:hypothetical protein n=1 Tax=uncultured Cetobacterium sp. TaxID=527638 RepID=UPI0026047670
LVCEKTNFIGTKIFQIFVSQAIRLTTYTFLVSITFKILDKKLEQISDVQSAFNTVLGLAGLTFLSWRTPDLVGGILNGTPSLNFSHAWQNAGNVTRGGKGAFNAAKNSNLAQNVKNGIKNSYSKFADRGKKK